ncbi:MAG: glycosyltransferase [Crocinitomicaceae bacterium]|nr:glycosyltransferase [Crocinitomicaceae bacterium]
MKTLDIVIPLYKSKATLEALIARLNEWNNAKQIELSMRVLFVEDGSNDGTFEFLKSIQSQIQFNFQAFRLTRNYGQHTAIATGLNCSTADVVVVMDDDLQHDPFEIELLVKTMNETNADIVYGTYKEKQHSMFRNFSSRVLKRITKSKSVDFSNVTSFKLMKSHVLSTLKEQLSPIVFVDVYLLQNAGNVATCEVNHAKRIAGKSTYSSFKLLQLTFGIILFHSSLPLKMIVRVGLSMSLVFFGMSCYYVYQKLFNDVEMGFTSIIVAIFLSTGLILVSLGIIGEYIRRIWVRQNQLEQITVAEQWNA